MRTLILLLAVLAAVLSLAIYVAANSPGRSQAEALLAEKGQAEEARKDAAERIESLEREDADLKKQLELAKASLNEQADKLAAAEKAAEKEALRLRGELDTALKQVAELSQKYADARDAEQKARLEADAARKQSVTVVKAPAAEVEVVHVGNNKHGQKNGRRHGPVASLPRTTPSFSELDTNQDGRLSFREYKVGYPDSTEEEFKALDTNGDGSLSIDEYKAGHPDPPVVSTKRAKRN